MEKHDKTPPASVSVASCPFAPSDVRRDATPIELLIGEGTSGWVFSAIDSIVIPPRRVAIKVLRPEHAEIPELLQRFQDRELALLHRIGQAGPARNVVRVLEPLLGWHRHLPFIVLEFINGPSLRERLDDQRPFEGEEAMRIGLGIVRGLIALHSVNIVHRDIKPANIRLRNGTEPVIVDFGIAAALDATSGRTATGKSLMTPRYAAPEQLAGGSVEAPCDVYALGIILEEMAASGRLGTQRGAALSESRGGDLPRSRSPTNSAVCCARLEPDATGASSLVRH